MRNGKGQAKGVQKEVWVYVFDIRSPNSPFGSNKDERRTKLLKTLKWNRPDFVSKGSARSCGRDVVRRLYELGFLLPMKDLAPLALGLDMAVFGELNRLIDEQKKTGKIESVPI